MLSLPSKLFLALICELAVIVPAKERVTANIVFVVDVSCSMNGDKFTQACNAFVEIAAQPIDEMNIAVIAFSDKAIHLDWAPAEDVVEHWTGLPSKDAIDKASDFLLSLGANGDTLVTPALIAALKQEKKKLSVVLVSDGEYHRETTASILDAIAACQQWRRESAFGEAVLAIYGVGAESEALGIIAKANTGGYFTEASRDTRPAD